MPASQSPASAETAEALGRRRTRTMALMLAVYAPLQFVLAGMLADTSRTVSLAPIAGWLVITAAFAIVLLTGGRRWRNSAQLMPLIDDEVTRANRRSATATGFAALMLTGAAAIMLAPEAMLSARQALHLVLSAGIVAAMGHFTVLEWRAYRA